MLLCDCPSCGRRELRGTRSLVVTHGGRFVLRCRHCTALVPATGSSNLTRPRPGQERLPAA